MTTEAFQRELAYLRQAGEGFAQAHPALAHHLGRQGTDPDVERLLEGFAFLTARIQERTAQCAPELIEEMASLMVPQLVRPTPACTIIEVTFERGALRGSVVLPAGTEVTGIAGDANAPCRFGTVAPMDVSPIDVVDSQIDYPQSHLARLRIHCQPHHALAEGPARLRFFVAAPYAAASALIAGLAEHTVQARLRQGDRVVTLPPQAVRLPLHDPHLALVSVAEEPSVGCRLLDEYVQLPEKFCFFDVALPPGPLAGEPWGIEILLRDLPALPTPLPPRAIRLHCVPARNVFAATAIPQRRCATAHPQLLRADGEDPLHTQVFDVRHVTGIVRGRSARATYQAFTSFLHGHGQHAAAYYRLHRRRSCIDNAADTYLSLHTPEDILPPHDAEVLSINLECTNRLLPRFLGRGDINRLADTGLARSATNVTSVSEPLQPPLGDESLWRSFARLSQGTGDITTVEALRHLLTLQVGLGSRRHASAAAHERRIAAVMALAQTAVPELIDGVPVLTRRSAIKLDEAGFAGAGDAYIYGRVLRALFESEAALQTAEGVTLQLHPSAREFYWPVSTHP